LILEPVSDAGSYFFSSESDVADLVTKKHLKEEVINDPNTYVRTMSEEVYRGGCDFYEHMFKLQEKAGLTFKEAFVVLSTPAYKKQLAKDWGVTPEAVMNLDRRGWDKISAFANGAEDLMYTIAPARFWHPF
jgi:hypothetical protein